MENSGIELQAKVEGKLSENDKRQIMDEMLLTLRRSKDNLTSYCEEHRKEKTWLTQELDDRAREESTKRLADFVKEKIADKSELGELVTEVKEAAEKDEIAKLRYVLEDPGKKETEKISALRQAGEWFILPADVLEKINFLIPDIKGRISTMMEESLAGSTPREDYMKISGIEESTRVFLDRMKTNTEKEWSTQGFDRRQWNSNLDLLASS
ncbi:MAG TPA: hypothetical protein PLI45_03170 [Candidatus Woesebacteria bacterium]|nr:hypothetical protein [Candidatus Woesebacteria bacterium]